MIFSRALLRKWKAGPVSPAASRRSFFSLENRLYLLYQFVDHLRFQNRQTSIWHRVFSPCLSKLQRSGACQLGSDLTVQILQFSR